MNKKKSKKKKEQKDWAVLELSPKGHCFVKQTKANTNLMNGNGQTIEVILPNVQAIESILSF
jgi:hypothetical protein